MGKKLSTTPRSRGRSALRQLWLRSRERAQALKDCGYTCQCCGKKQSTAKGREVKVEVHHCEGVLNWDALIDLVFAYLLTGPENLKVLCKECHAEEHKQEAECQ